MEPPTAPMMSSIKERIEDSDEEGEIEAPLQEQQPPIMQTPPQMIPQHQMPPNYWMYQN